jgi:hypothetical protein
VWNELFGVTKRLRRAADRFFRTVAKIATPPLAAAPAIAQAIVIQTEFIREQTASRRRHEPAQCPPSPEFLDAFCCGVLLFGYMLCPKS